MRLSPRAKARSRATSALAAMLALFLFVAACGEQDNNQVTAGVQVPEGDEDSSSSTDGTAADGDSSTSQPAEEGEEPVAEVVDANGDRVVLPIIDDGGSVMGDSTSDHRTPSSLREEKERGPLADWGDAFERLGNYDYYVEGLNDRAAQTGFGWDDVKRFSETEDVEARAIVVFNWPDLSDQEAREGVRGIVGEDAARLNIVHINSCVVNTRGFLDQPGMEDFVDCRRMVRASLLPIVYDREGKPVGLSAKSGIFLDCFNLWRLPRQVKKPPTTTTTSPPGTTPTTQPPGSTTPTTSPGTTSTTRPSTTTTQPTTTTTVCGRKCNVPTTVAPPPTTSRPPGTTPTTRVTTTTVTLPPTTSTAPPPSTSTPPTTRVEY